MVAFYFPPYLTLTKLINQNQDIPTQYLHNVLLKFNFISLQLSCKKKDSSLLNRINHFCDYQVDLFELGKFKVKNVIITQEQSVHIWS